MKELKFRAWDKERKRMFRVWKLTFSGINHPEVSELMDRPHPRFGLEEAELKHHPLDTIIMQYTGLKDKDGKEIYEKDIIKAHLESKWDKRKKTWTAVEYLRGRVIYDEKHGVYVINHDGYFYRAHPECDLAVNTSMGNNLPLHNFVALEVIGNIYENPDLLKKKGAK